MSPEKVTVCFLLSFNFPRLLFSSQDSMEVAALLRTYGRATDRMSQIILIEYHQTNTERRGQRGRKFGMRHGFCKISRTATEATWEYTYISRGPNPITRNGFVISTSVQSCCGNQDDSYIRATPCYTKKSGPPPRRNINICRTSRRPARGINIKAK